MEEIKSQENDDRLNEIHHLTKQICKIHLYDTLKTIACMSALLGCGEVALFNNSTHVRKTALATAVCVGLSSVGVGRLLDKKVQKLDEQRTQVLKEYVQLSKA